MIPVVIVYLHYQKMKPLLFIFYTTENDHLSYKVVNPYLRGECHDINLSNHISWIDSALQNYQITQKALCIEVKTHLVVGWT